jgi:hypothetical protein
LTVPERTSVNHAVVAEIARVNDEITREIGSFAITDTFLGS